MKKSIVRGIMVKVFAVAVYYYEVSEKNSNVASNEPLSHVEG